MNGQDYSELRMVAIDDDRMLLDNLKHLLVEFGASVAAFESPEAAIDWIQHNGADIAITDIVMPGCDGFEVLKRIKAIDPQCEVILLTGHGQIEMVIRALREGATDFFEKPFDPGKLRAAIERTTRYRMLSRQRDLLSARLTGVSRELHLRKGGSKVMVGQSDAMKKVARSISDVVDTSVTVMIVGESGTGKELVANAIHEGGPRRDKPLLTLNCASIPETLFESEMFGHIRGSFTGATASRIGYVEAANGGTLFLDEIGDLPMSLQGKILRLLEQKVYLPVGAVKERSADVRLIAATNHPLEELVAKKEFREDLYYRLSVYTITIPPLRERKEDIPILALHLALDCAEEFGKSIDGIDEDALEILAGYEFLGNVRELRNVIENAVLRCRHSGKLRASDLPARGPALGPAEDAMDAAWPLGTVVFEDVERKLYTETLKRTHNNVSAAAELLKISRGKLRRRLAALGM